MKVQGVKTNEAKPAPAAEKPKAEKSAFDKLMRGKADEEPTPDPTAGAMPLPAQPAPVMKKDETPGPASSRLLDNVTAEIATTLNTKDIQEVEIKFDSKTLAGLQVSIRSDHGKLLVKMQAATSEVANLLERNTTGLVERLAEKGYTGTEIRVDRSAVVAKSAETARPKASPPPPPPPAYKRGPQ